MSGGKDKTLPEKLKQFFKFAKSPAPAASSAQQTAPLLRLRVEKFLLTREVQSSISREAPTAQRLKALQEIGEAVAVKRIEDDAAETLWLLINDLFVQNAVEERHAALVFLKQLIMGQYERLGMLRVYIFDVIRESIYHEDVAILIELLKAMSNTGKDLLYMEDTIGLFLLHFLPRVSQSQLMAEFLPFLLNVIKFNSAYVDGNVIDGVVRCLCDLAVKSLSEQDEQQTLVIVSVFDAIICYSNLPNESIVVFTSTLCRLVNKQALNRAVWKVMRNLIGTYLGTTTLYTLIHCLQTSDDPSLLRGGIFFTGMVLFGPERPANCPSWPPAVILPALSETLKHTHHPLVLYEMSLTLDKLVKADGPNLVGLAWDWILDLLHQLLRHIDQDEQQEHRLLKERVLKILTDIETMVERDTYTGSVELFFATLERALPHVDEPSVLRLMDFQVAKIGPSQPAWVTVLSRFVQRFYVEEKRIGPRLKVLQVLTSLMTTQRGLHDEELLEVVVLPVFQNLHTEHEMEVRRAAVELIISLCQHCNSKHCTGLLDILERIMERPFNVPDQGDVVNIPSDDELGDVVTCTTGLVALFLVKLNQLPSQHAIQIYKLLVRHAHLHYEKSMYFEFAFATKLAVFEFILNITTDGENRLGHASLARCSPYILIDSKLGERAGAASRKEPLMAGLGRGSADEYGASPAHGHVTYVSLSEACMVVIRCLGQERDWRVLRLVLECIPRVLSNKALVLSRHSADVDLLAKALCALITDPTLNNPETLRNAPARFSRSEFQQFVFRVLTCLASYHAHLKPEVQQKLVKCLEVGLKFKDTAKTCVVALTVSALEMKDTMYKLLPGVLLNLSKISATVSIAPNILEFLSTLNRLPEVYSSFVEEQYLSIFAITLPFINPFKFNHYVVSLAHHVVSLWFLSCKFPLRKNFVRYIVQGFKNNVLIPCKEEMISAQNPPVGVLLANEDSSLRGRSSSLSSRSSATGSVASGSGAASLAAAGGGLGGATGSAASGGGGGGGGGMGAGARMLSGEIPTKCVQDDNRIMFHRELMETCADLMSRYTYGNSAPYAQQSDIVRYLLKDGPCQSWLIGHKLVTIKTSQCSRVATRRGLCDRCWLLCKLDPDEVNSDAGEAAAASAAASAPDLAGGFRRRHRSAISSMAGLASLDLPAVTSGAPDDFQTKLRSRHKSSVDDRRSSIDFDDPLRDPSDGDGKGANGTMQTPCMCYCSGWALVHVRRPTGDTCWVTRVLNPPQSCNDVFLLSDWSDEPVPNLANMFAPLRADSVDVAGTAEAAAAATAAAGAAGAPGAPGAVGAAAAAAVVPAAATGVVAASAPPPLACVEGDAGAVLSSAPTADRSPASNAGSFSPPPTSKFNEARDWNDVAPFGTDDAEASSASSLTERPSIARQTSLKELASASRKSCEAIPEEAKEADGPAASSSSASTTPVTPHGDAEAHLQPLPRDRVYTMPALNLRRANVDLNPRRSLVGGALDSAQKEAAGSVSGTNPSFIFLQLYYSPLTSSNVTGKEAHHGTGADGGAWPILVPANNQTAIKNLDRIPSYETHKIGVIYVGRGQAGREAEILSNEHGSVRYMEFLHRLGRLVSLDEVDTRGTYIGGLEVNGEDGKFAYMWKDDVLQVIFHVATLMPTKETDPACTNKKRHIGNDYVTIVYNDSGDEYALNTIRGQFNHACVVVEPLDHATHRVILKCRDDLHDLMGGPVEPKLVSDRNVALLSRQMAFHANLAALILQSKPNYPYASNWLERLRQIKRIKARLEKEEDVKEKEKEKYPWQQHNLSSTLDFTELTCPKVNG